MRRLRLRSQPFANAFQRAPGIAESVEWAKALVALDTLEVDPEVVADTDAMLLAAGESIDDFAGGTRLGGSLAELRRRHARRLTGRRTLVLVISDGLDTGEPEVLERELLWLKRHSRKLLWLNPLLRYDGYSPLARGAAVLHRHADAMLAVHNLNALGQLAASLAALMRSGR